MDGIDLKNAGQQLALFNAGDWVDYIIGKLRDFCQQQKAAGKLLFKFEDFRVFAEQSGFDMPKSHKVWGAVPRVACKKGLIKPTKEVAPAESKKTHGHLVRVWQVAC